MYKWLTNFFISSFLTVTFVTAAFAQKQTLAGDHLIYFGAGALNPAAFTFSIFSNTGGGNPSFSGNINYQIAVDNRFLIGVFGSYFRVNADFKTNYDEIAAILENADFNDVVNNLDCILLGNCETTIQERLSIYSTGVKLSYVKQLDPKFETYMSGYLGYSFVQTKTITESLISSFSEELEIEVDVPRFIYFSSVGIRYFLNYNWAIQLEVGYGNSHLLNIGLSYKLISL